MTLIISDNKKVETLQKELEESSSTIKLLNDKVNRLVEQLGSQGCVINHAMGLDFTVENSLADSYANCLIKTMQIIQFKGVFPETVKEIDTLLKQREIKE